MEDSPDGRQVQVERGTHEEANNVQKDYRRREESEGVTGAL